MCYYDFKSTTKEKSKTEKKEEEKENESGQQASNNKKRFYVREWEYWYEKVGVVWSDGSAFIG